MNDLLKLGLLFGGAWLLTRKRQEAPVSSVPEGSVPDRTAEGVSPSFPPRSPSPEIPESPPAAEPPEIFPEDPFEEPAPDLLPPEIEPPSEVRVAPGIRIIEVPPPVSGEQPAPEEERWVVPPPPLSAPAGETGTTPAQQMREKLPAPWREPGMWFWTFGVQADPEDVRRSCVGALPIYSRSAAPVLVAISYDEVSSWLQVNVFGQRGADADEAEGILLLGTGSIEAAKVKAAVVKLVNWVTGWLRANGAQIVKEDVPRIFVRSTPSDIIPGLSAAFESMVEDVRIETPPRMS